MKQWAVGLTFMILISTPLASYAQAQVEVIYEGTYQEAVTKYPDAIRLPLSTMLDAAAVAQGSRPRKALTIPRSVTNECSLVGTTQNVVIPGYWWLVGGIDTEVVSVSIGGANCMGRCGVGCPGDGPAISDCTDDNGYMRYTEDCVVHDACAARWGRLDARCDSIFPTTFDDCIKSGIDCCPAYADANFTDPVPNFCARCGPCAPGDGYCNSSSECEGNSTCGFDQTCQCECNVVTACCDGCYYKPSSTVCRTNADLEYGCLSGLKCGNAVGVRYRDAYCSGVYSGCRSSDLGSWKAWSTVEQCSQDELCLPGAAQCLPDSSCYQCQPGSGPCCDGSGKYKSSSTVCHTNANSEYGCPWGTGCGDDVGVRYQDRYCSGSSSSCGGSYGSWSGWAQAQDCAPTASCSLSLNTATCSTCSVCGNGIKEGSEQCDGSDDVACPGRCQSDCSCAAAPICGDGTCDPPGETCGNCGADCGYPASCGNGTCEPDCSENNTNCPTDCAATLPDLTVPSVSLLTRSTTPGGDISFNVTFSNILAESPPLGVQTWGSVGYLSTDQMLDMQDVQIPFSVVISSYSLDSVWDQPISFTPPIPDSTPPGFYYVIYNVDDDDVNQANGWPGVVEANEDNNWGVSSKMVNVTGPTTTTIPTTTTTTTVPPLCDVDGDGYIDTACAGGTDCDDSRTDVNPGMVEGLASSGTCIDGLDNDCDGKTDVEDVDCRVGEPCQVTFGVTDAWILGALQFDVDYGRAQGKFLGSGGSAECTSMVGAVFNNDESINRLTLAFASSSGVVTPTDVAVCSFDRTGDVSVSDFDLRVTDASAPDATPASPTVAVTKIDCPGVCGDGRVDSGEQCDDGDVLWQRGEPCRADCTLVNCGDPDDNGGINAVDALYLLQTAVGTENCDPLVCDVTNDGQVTATDALIVLKKGVGQNISLQCPHVS